MGDDVLMKVFKKLVIKHPQLLGNTIILVTWASVDMWWIFHQDRLNQDKNKKKKPKKRSRRKRRLCRKCRNCRKLVRKILKMDPNLMCYFVFQFIIIIAILLMLLTLF